MSHRGMQQLSWVSLVFGSPTCVSAPSSAQAVYTFSLVCGIDPPIDFVSAGWLRESFVFCLPFNLPVPEVSERAQGKCSSTWCVYKAAQSRPSEAGWWGRVHPLHTKCCFIPRVPYHGTQSSCVHAMACPLHPVKGSLVDDSDLHVASGLFRRPLHHSSSCPAVDLSISLSVSSPRPLRRASVGHVLLMSPQP